jgi:hypothetical protein
MAGRRTHGNKIIVVVGLVFVLSPPLLAALKMHRHQHTCDKLQRN